MERPYKQDLPNLVTVTGYPPNRKFGGGIILHNLLSAYPTGKLTVITVGSDLTFREHQKQNEDFLPVPHIPIYPWRSRIPGVRRLLRSVNVFKLFSTTMTIMRHISQDTAILAVPWGGEFGSELFASAFLAHRISGAPLIVYELDEWRASLGRHSGRVSRILERIFHGEIVKAAQTLWVISDALAAEFFDRFKVRAQVMPNAVDVERYSAGRHGERAHQNEFRLIYTGGIYGAQADSIRNVIAAIRSLPECHYSLVIYTTQSREQLASMGISDDCLSVEKAVPLDHMPQLLGTADALLLPFSFLREQCSIVSTSLPAKTADYLASGVPVLVHAPAYATVTRYASSEGWGEVVDSPTQQGLLAALHRLSTDEARRAQLVERALFCAYSRHDLKTCRAAFIASIQEAALIHS